MTIDENKLRESIAKSRADGWHWGPFGYDVIEGLLNTLAALRAERDALVADVESVARELEASIDVGDLTRHHAVRKGIHALRAAIAKEPAR